MRYSPSSTACTSQRRSHRHGRPAPDERRPYVCPTYRCNAEPRAAARRPRLTAQPSRLAKGWLNTKHNLLLPLPLQRKSLEVGRRFGRHRNFSVVLVLAGATAGATDCVATVGLCRLSRGCVGAGRHAAVVPTRAHTRQVVCAHSGAAVVADWPAAALCCRGAKHRSGDSAGRAEELFDAAPSNGAGRWFCRALPRPGADTPVPVLAR